jgi:hypothetical protein
MLKLRYLLILALIAWVPVSAEEVKTLVWPDGTRYVGGVKDGKRSGKGTIFWQDGTRFVGTFVDDLRHGPGTMVLPDGTVYNGYFENDALVQNAPEVRSEPTAPVAEITADDVTQDTAITVAAAEPVETPASPDPIATPVAENETPVAENETPVAENENPVAENENPVAENETPVAENETPVAEDETPVAEAEPAPLPVLTVETRKQVQAAIDAWASAWADQNVDGYLAAYAESFEVPSRQSRRQWEGLRRSRLSRPSRINVTITYDTFEVISADQIQVDFNQIYDSNLFSDRTNKRLVMIQEGSDWKILSERSI